MDHEDRRRVSLSLTDEGMVVYDRIVPVLYASERALMAGLTPQEEIEFHRVCRIIAEKSALFQSDKGFWQQLLDEHGYSATRDG